MGSDQHFQGQGAKLTRWLFAMACVFAVVLALVVHAAGGPWYGVLTLTLIALAAAYFAILAPDHLVLRVDRWIATVLHWSP
jgi:cell division protein FtsW (lipid II flippase)